MGATCDKYFETVTVDSDSFPKTPQVDMGFRATGLLFIMDTPDEDIDWAEWSIDGRTVHGKILGNDRHIVLDEYDVQKIWFRGPNGQTHNVRVIGWIKQR